jgi:hypothetical protein
MPMSIVVVSELATASAAIETRTTRLLAEPSVLAKFIVAILEVICELAGESASAVRAQALLERIWLAFLDLVGC